MFGGAEKEQYQMFAYVRKTCLYQIIGIQMLLYPSLSPSSHISIYKI